MVNFAAQSEVGPSWNTPWEWFQTNAVALTRLVHFLSGKAYLRRYVHISSPEVYGTCVGTVREEQPMNPSTPYAASKAAGDFSIFTYGKKHAFPYVMIRSTNVYGPHQQLFKIIPRAFINLQLGRTIELHGGGRAVKSYIHIRDISRGELAAMEQGRAGEMYHLSPDAGVSVRDLVGRICAAAGVDFAAATRDVAERLGQDAAYVIDSSKARAEFGWQPEVGLDAGAGPGARLDRPLLGRDPGPAARLRAPAIGRRLRAVHIGLDFDNTVVTYDELFHRCALERGLIDPAVRRHKKDIRDSIRRHVDDGERKWTELQGVVYGLRMDEAEEAPGIEAFLRQCRARGVRVSIISHKTLYPAIGPRVSLRAAARRWLRHQGFTARFGIAPGDIHFVGTLPRKLGADPDDRLHALRRRPGRGARPRTLPGRRRAHPLRPRRLARPPAGVVPFASWEAIERRLFR